MLRFLIVEDDPVTQMLMSAMLRKAFPSARVDTAYAVDEATVLLRAAAAERFYFDAVILDYKLPPHRGLTAEGDDSLCRLVGESMRRALVVHVTAFIDDEALRDHLKQLHHQAIGPPGFFQPKLEAEWGFKVARQLQTYLYSEHVSKQVRQLFSPDPFDQVQDDDLCVPQRDATSALAALRRDVAAYWPYLTTAVRDEVQQYLTVGEHDGERVVSLVRAASES